MFELLVQFTFDLFSILRRLSVLQFDAKSSQNMAKWLKKVKQLESSNSMWKL